MTDLFWPSALEPGESDFQLVDFSARFVGPVTGSSRAYSRPGGQLIRASLTLPTLVGQRKAVLQSLVAGLRGAVNRVWLFDHSYVRRGNFPATELLANNTFQNGLTGWTGDAAVTRAVADRTLRLSFNTTPATSTAVVPSSALTFVSGAQYAARFASYGVRGAIQRGIQSDSTTFGLTWGSTSNSTTEGVRTVSVLAGGASGYVNIEMAATGAAISDSIDVPWISCARCALVAGASQTSHKLTIDALPVSTSGLLLYGDQVQIGTELFFVCASLDSDASGVGTLVLHRPPRTPPADNALVIIHQPMGKFLLQERENGWTNRAPQTADSTLVFIEATD